MGVDWLQLFTGGIISVTIRIMALGASLITIRSVGIVIITRSSRILILKSTCRSAMQIIGVGEVLELLSLSARRMFQDQSFKLVY